MIGLVRRGAALVAAAGIAAGLHAADKDRVQALIADIQAGPRTYQTSAALEYLSLKAGYAAQPLMPDLIERANKALRATAALGDMRSAAMGAVGTLVDYFTTAVHVVTVYETYYAGEGSLEDRVMTKVMGERNKFMLTAPFLGYEQLSKCDRHVTESHETALASEQYSAGRLLSANITLHITFTVYAAACALNAITGADFGTDASQWRSWWIANQYTLTAAPPPAPVQPPPAQPAAASAVSGRNVVVGATYRFTLTTGDVFTARVESRTDTSVIAETNEGNAYTFRIPLIRECVMTSPPPQPAAPAGAGRGEALTFDELKRRSPQGMMLQVRIKSGQAFEGRFASIDDENVRLDVSGSQIPIHKDVIAQILTMPSGKTPPAPAPAKPEARKPPSIPDTVIVRNPKTDEWGRQLASFVYVGTIVDDYGERIVLERTDGARVEVKRTEVERVIRHSTKSDPALDAIQRYAKQLFCPSDMVLVDLPPGKDGRPFFKTCVDKYEYPNEMNAVPKGNLSYEDARRICEAKGKRLCTAEEWQWACSGLEGMPYPYGYNYNENTCNSSSKGISASGDRTNCVSKFGLYDMTGNVFEWVTGAKDKPMLMGGPQAKCQTVSPGVDGSAKPLSGLRCCKSN